MANDDFKFDERATALAKAALSEDENASSALVQAALNEEKNNSSAPVTIEHQDALILQKETLTLPNEQDKTQVLQNEEINDDKTQQANMYGKFKNPQELLKAYGELEKEFTRRSQRLKQLENSVKPFESEEEWHEAADKFFEKTPSAKALAREIANEISLDPSLKESRDCFEKALVRALAKSYRTPEQLMADGQFLKDYVFNDKEVQKVIIQNFLDEIRKSQPPYTLPRGGQSAAACFSAPKTVREAGSMFLRENK